MYVFEIKGNIKLKKLIFVIVMLMMVNMSFGNQDLSAVEISSQDSTSVFDVITIMPAYTNENGKQYTVKNPSFVMQVSILEENIDDTKVNVYLNDKVVVENSVAQGNFTLTKFESYSSTFTINDDDDLFNFVRADSVNEIYFELNDTVHGLHEVSDVINFYIEQTPPTIDIYDEDDDMIIGTYRFYGHDVWVYLEVHDPESHIRMSECSMQISDIGGTDTMIYSSGTFDIAEEYEDGFKIQNIINFADFSKALWDLPNGDSIPYHLEICFTAQNRLGMTITEKRGLSFDLLDPVITLDSHNFNWEYTDSVGIDNDNDGRVNEDPIDSLNNDGDWNDVNENGVLDTYILEYYEMVYDSIGNVIDSIYHSEEKMEEEFIDEDPIDFQYVDEQWVLDNNKGLNIQFKLSDPDGIVEYDGKKLWSATSGIDNWSFRGYIDGEMVDCVLDADNILYFESDPLPHGQHNISVSVYDHAGRGSWMGFRVYAKHSTSIDEGVTNPAKFSLNQSYPNPFNPTTTISYSLAKESDVKLTIYNVLGNKVETIVDEQKTAGYHKINWDASALPSGLYFYKLETKNFVDFKKCMLVK